MILYSGESLSDRLASGQQLFTLAGHLGTVLKVAFSPDGTRLATVGYDKTVRVWDMRPGSELLEFRAHERGAGMTFSPDGGRLATFGVDGIAKLWEARTGRALLTLRGHQAELSNAKFSPDGTRIATAGSDGVAKVWDTATGRELLTLRGHQGKLTSLDYSADGEWLATASADKTAKLWDAQTGRELRILVGHQDRVVQVAVNPAGNRVVTSSMDRTVKVWNAATGQNLLTFRGHDGPVYVAAFSPDGRHGVSSSLNSLRLWDAGTGREQWSVRTLVGGALFLPSGNRIVAGLIDPMMLDADSGRTLFVMKPHQVWSKEWLGISSASMSISRDGKHLGIVDRGVVRVYALEVRELMALARGRITLPLTAADCASYFRTEACPALP